MKRLAAAAGCRVVGVQRWLSRVPGRPGLAWELLCPSHEAKLKLLDLMAWNEAKRDMQLRELALELAQEAGPSPVRQAAAIHRFVRDNIHFQREPRETFQGAWWTLYYARGDCDCQAKLVAVLARALRLPVRLKALYPKHGPRVPTHVAAQFGFPVKLKKGQRRRWVWAETTLRGARFGEHPVAAKRRLDAGGRSDIQ